MYQIVQIKMYFVGFVTIITITYEVTFIYFFIDFALIFAVFINKLVDIEIQS